MGGNAPCIINAANEVVVAKFLKGEISFLGMSDVIETVLHTAPFIKQPDYNDYVQTDAITRTLTEEIASKTK